MFNAIFLCVVNERDRTKPYEMRNSFFFFFVDFCIVNSSNRRWMDQSIHIWMKWVNLFILKSFNHFEWNTASEREMNSFLIKNRYSFTPERSILFRTSFVCRAKRNENEVFVSKKKYIYWRVNKNTNYKFFLFVRWYLFFKWKTIKSRWNQTGGETIHSMSFQFFLFRFFLAVTRFSHNLITFLDNISFS